MTRKTRGPRNVRLGCEVLEDRVTPAVAYALSGTNLLAFDTATPTVTTTTAITGVAVTDTLVGIDFRPQNGQLYGLGVNAGADTATLYTVSARTGVATAVGGVGAITGAGDLQAPSATVGYGFDFNPTVDRVRVVTGNLNFRVDPNTGTLVQADTAVTGGTTTVDATAYTNSAANVAVTTQYTLDQASNSLYIQGLGDTPNNGVQTLQGVVTVNGQTLDFTAVNGFDIPTGVNTNTANQPVGSGSALAVLQVGGQSGLYSINLTSGAATLVGNVGNGAAVQGLAVQSDAAGIPAVALNATGTNLLRFSTASPGTVTTSPAITGVDAAEVLVGVDFRPNTGQLYALGVNAGTGNGTLYIIDPQTAVATRVGAANGLVDLIAALPAATVGYGFDFNPTAAGGVTLIRVTTGSGLNFRVSPDTGTVAGTDTNINGGGSTGVTATAYTNSFGQAGTTATTQYTLDSAQNRLFIQNAPNAGTQTMGVPVTVNGAALDFTEVNGFDIPAGVRVGAANAAAAGFGYAVLTSGAGTRLYQINLATGAATDLGAVAAGAGLALGDSTGGTVSFQSATVTGNEGASGISVVLTRTGGTGPQVVTVNVTGGTATAGTDFTGGPYTVVFADGATTATLNIPFANDSTTEGPETLTLSIAAVSNGLIGAQSTTTVTANDTAQLFGQVFAASAGQTLVAVLPTGATQPTVFNPYADLNIAGGVRVAVGDVNNDGVNDLVTINAVGAPLVRVFSGTTGALLTSFQAYPATINIPASVAVGDVNNDGFDDIVLSTTTTIGAVLVFSGRDFSQIGLFLPGGGIPIGFNVAVADTNGDQSEDIILGTVTGLSAVAIFSGTDFSLQSVFLPFGGLALGTNVAAGDLDNDGLTDLVVGTNSTVPAVLVFNGRNPTTQPTLFFPFGAFGGGASVAVADVNGDGLLDIIAGTTAGASTSIAFDGRTLAPLNTFSPFGGFNGGITVA